MGATELPCAGAPCKIPKLDPLARRVIEIHNLIIRLGDLVDPGTVCRICNVESSDLYLLATVEDELKRIKKARETG